jgi:hypothetical protein
MTTLYSATQNPLAVAIRPGYYREKRFGKSGVHLVARSRATPVEAVPDSEKATT